MKRALAKHTVESSDNFERQSFTVDFSAEMFNLISNTLYSRPVEAIIRELGCNAYDSHVQHGNPEKPFEVKLPTRLDTEFHIRDYGTGLTPKEVKEVYTVVFKSDKTHTNDLTGCFGVGSKSPFSYATQFGVESIVDGTKWIYSCFLDEGGIPCIADLSGGGFATDEPNGVKISFDVDLADHRTFRNAAEKVYPFFTKIPTVHGTTITEPNFEESGDGWAFRSTFYGINPIAIMGNVAYDLDLQKLDIGDIPRNMVMYFELGELTPAASREYLQYDELTVTSIEKRYNEILDSMKKEIQKEVDKCKSLFEARVRVNKFESTSTLGRTIAKKVQWKGKDQDWKYRMSPKTVDQNWKLWQFVAGNKTKANYVPVHDKVKFVVTDTNTLKHKKTGHASSLDPTTTFIVPTGMTEQECKDFVKEIGLGKDHILYVSKMATPAKSSNPSSGKKMGVVRKFKCGYYTRQRDFWNDDPGDLPDHAYYVVRKAHRVSNRSGSDFIPPYDFYTKVRDLENIGVKVKIFSVTKSNVDNVPAEWKPFWEEYDKFMNWLSSHTDADRLYDLKMIAGDRTGELLRKGGEVDDPRAKQIKKMLDEWWSNRDAYEQALQKIDVKPGANTEGRTLISELKKDYPLIKKYKESYGYHYKQNAKAEDYIDYMNVMYKEKYATIHSS